MNDITRIKLGLAAIGVITWAYGARLGNRSVQWLGIAFIGVAALLRFVRRPPRA
ncbi:MAG: hypothetical protein ABR543_06620 [Gemmatimonadaceae bacterium]